MKHTQESNEMVVAVANVLSETCVAKQNDDYNNIAQMVESAALENKAAAAFKAVNHLTGGNSELFALHRETRLKIEQRHRKIISVTYQKANNQVSTKG